MVEPMMTRRGQMDVLGENEALQQFFDSQDVSGVLDTRMLEQYLSNSMDPSSCILPDSPPDSGSEPCSPPQAPGLFGAYKMTSEETSAPHNVHYCSSWHAARIEHETHPTLRSPPSSACCFRDHFPGPQSTSPHLSAQMDTFLTASCPPAPSAVHSSPPHLPHQSSAHNYAPVHAPTQLSQCRNPNPLCGTSRPLFQSQAACPSPACPYLDAISGQQTGTAVHENKKRRHSLEGTSGSSGWDDVAWTHGALEGPECSSGDAPSYNGDMQGGGGPGPVACRTLTWDAYLCSQWIPLYKSSYESLPVPGYHVETDKGFNYSPADEAFVCQKKNHFQVTVHIGMAGDPRYVKTVSGFRPIQSFHIKVFGIKLEAPSHLVTIEQSQSDRSKKPFLPVKVNLPGDKITKVTLGRLHFGETTANNMRKKGKPNPEQRYFLLVVGLYACLEEESHLLVAHISERIIVRASNPGQFENDEMPWQRGAAPDAVVCHGRVGVNTDAPDEALVVCGNVKVMGTVMHPSDKRAKQNIQEVDSNEQLKRIAQMRIVEYDYKPEFASKMGINQVHETGIIAQEVKELLPSAVREVGDIVCSDGEKIPNFLMVDKERIFMENVGAVKQLCKLTDNLETRIQELEVWNKRLAKLKDAGGLRSSVVGSLHRKVSKVSSIPPPQRPSPVQTTNDFLLEKFKHCFHHKVFQATVFVLVATMAFCVISITALYMFTLQRDNPEPSDTISNISLPSLTAPSATTSTSTPGPWPPDVDFCSLLYCDEVYCCPTEPGNLSFPQTTPSLSYLSPGPSTQEDEKTKLLYKKLEGGRDWTNTTVKSIFIKENQQIIDHHYCAKGNCGPGNYSYVIPISKFVPVNMRITIQMNTTELLVVHLCHIHDTSTCSTLKDYSDVDSYTTSNTQGYIHEWPLPVARLYQSSYHFRTSVAGQANCSTDSNYVKLLFTDYHFYFYRRCD